MRYLKWMVPALFAVSAATATAGPLLDFTGVGDGAQVMDFYNGGTDSMGNSGVNYGIHFESGTVAYNVFGAYIQGPAVMTFDPNIVPLDGQNYFQIGFLADKSNDDGAFSYINGPHYSDATWVQGTVNPFCHGKADWECREEGYNVIFRGSTFGYTVLSDGTANRISFNTDSLDDISFGVTQRPRDRILPEPATYALFGLGLFGLAAMHRRRHKA